MRTLTSLILLVSGLFLISTQNSHAQTYDISWHVIAGGGGTSSATSNGTTYSVSGTIGQPATSTLSGGPYSLTGGFWGIIATVQMPGSPLLSILNATGHNVVLAWPAASTGFMLQQTSTLTPTSWTTVSTNSFPVIVNNGTNTVTLPVSGNQYFRLVNP
jgi:hypothetical protein